MRMKLRLLFLAVCLTLLGTLAPMDIASARPPCPRYWVQGHYNRYGRWIRPHWKVRRWIPGHYNYAGMWVSGHCR